MRVNTRIAQRLKKIAPSSTLAITSKAKALKAQGRDIVNLSAGEPDFDTPQPIKDAAIAAIESGFTKYTPTTGIPELRELISGKLKKDNHLEYAPEQIVVSCGAKHSIVNAVLALINRHDEVLVPLPYWVSYPEMVALAEGESHFIKTLPENNFKVTPEELKKHINPKTKLFILNTPSNPTGCVYTKDELEKIAEICSAKKIFVLSDEIYEKLIYGGGRHISIAGLNKDIYGLTLTVNGLSKSYSMTGWRIGYLAGPQDVVDAISNLQDHSTSNPCSISQKAAAAALRMPEEFLIGVRRQFEERMNYCVARLKGMKKISCVPPQGAFYIFCDISRTGLDSGVFAERLLNESFVSLVPGKGFGADNFVRISFAAQAEQLQKGMDRLQSWLEKL
ncbi:MAG: aspartate aminotransferase [Omnitrophica WOR_2 bacterium RIFCSPLOWO2_12_FULL_51_8]|nr:MAG: aspartate aminotransferase [Omnitrophica WOR_2 bacterium RIFCSPLOWO2_12_FULL_51_8]